MKKFILLNFLLSTLLLTSCTIIPITPYHSTVEKSNLITKKNDYVKKLTDAFTQNCLAIINKKNNPIGSKKEWLKLCKNWNNQKNKTTITNFINKNFKPYNPCKTKKVLFTGYYTPLYNGSLVKTKKYDIPVFKLPKTTHFNMVNRLDSRATIAKKITLKQYNDQQVLLWLTNKIDLFFLQIQGSGIIKLPNNKLIFISYAGHNNHAYVSIGKVLKEKKLISYVSMQTIKNWIKNHKDKTDWLLNHNPRYIFFQISQKKAITTKGNTAIPEITLAIDPKYIPYGSLLLIKTKLTANQKVFNHIMLAQDTGTAIKGPLKADIYFGDNHQAEYLAGEQQERGNLTLLIPKNDQINTLHFIQKIKNYCER